MSTKLNSSLPDLELRFGTADDVALVLQFIKELARYEKLEHEVVATEEQLRRSLFGERRVAEVILALYKGEPCGFALFFHNYSTFLGQAGIYLEDLYVRETFRGLGIGKELLACLARLAVERDCGRLEWWVLDWNEPAIQFYQALGAEEMDEWTVFRLTGQALTELAKRS